MAFPSPKSVVPDSPTESLPVAPTPESVIRPTVIMSEEDAYITERAASQPATLDEVRQIKVHTDTTKSRLALPDYFERFSYDCTNGPACKVHAWAFDATKERWAYGNRGEFLFHWTKKVKRAIDHAMNVQEWLFVNRRYFTDAPGHLFSANGGVELGDVILFFLPAKQALLLRAAPGKRSNEAIRSRLTRVKDGKVLMTAHPESEQFYVPDSVGGSDETTDRNETTPGIQEDRDF